MNIKTNPAACTRAPNPGLSPKTVHPETGYAGTRVSSSVMPFQARRHFREIPTLVAFLMSGHLLVSACGVAQTQTAPAAAASVTPDPYKLQVTSNLVTVRLVVRDAQGNPVKGLKKEDLKLFDKGKQQSITQFTAYPPVTTAPATPTASDQSPSPLSPNSPLNFTAYYFDDLNTRDADLRQARDAVDHFLSANLRPQDKVAIFTTGQMLSNFTSDPKQIHDALSKLHANPQAMNLNHDCPELSDYQAEQIMLDPDGHKNNDAWTVALTEASERCHLGTPPSRNRRDKTDSTEADPHLIMMVRMLAESIVDQSEIQTRNNLRALERLVGYVAQMPGHRRIVLVSPGVLAENEQPQLDQIIDRALHAEVVIHSLDPRGLVNLSREGDASKSYLGSVPGAGGALQDLDNTREFLASSVIAEFAKGTGGQYFHRNNDLQAGLSRLQDPTEYYTLAFVPTNLKPDGKFHPLSVQLAVKHPDFTIQARRGYFARKLEAGAQVAIETKAGAKTEANTEVASQVTQESDAELQVREQVRQAILSKQDDQQLTVSLDATVASTNTQVRQLTLSAHLSTQNMHFQKVGERNLNEVLFAFAVFDRIDSPVSLQQGWAKVDASDAELRQILASGLQMDVTFLLKPGIYRVRQVVMDSQESRLTSRSREIKIP
jgi:VWFA-related protein